MNPNDPNELESLLAATSAGDRDSFARLYSVTSAKLFGVIVRILRERQSSEEALQETFLRIWNYAGDFRPDRGRPMSWLITVARNQALDRRRRERTVPPAEDVEDAGIHAPDPGPLDCSVHASDVEMLKHCLDALAASQRRCIQLAYRYGYTHAELSTAIGRPIGTVKSWTRRGLARLRECMSHAG